MREIYIIDMYALITKYLNMKDSHLALNTCCVVSLFSYYQLLVINAFLDDIRYYVLLILIKTFQISEIAAANFAANFAHQPGAMFASSSRVRTRRVVSFVDDDCFTHFVELKSQSITRRSCACHARQFGQNISSIYIDCMENPPAILFRCAQLLTSRLGVYYGGRMCLRARKYRESEQGLFASVYECRVRECVFTEDRAA